MKSFKELVIDEKGYMVTAIFYLVLYGIACIGVQMKLNLTLWHSYVWFFKEFAIPVTLLWACTLIHVIAWAIYILKREVFNIKKCEK